MAAINGHKVGAIKRAIENHIHPKNGRSFIYSEYANWYVGITNNPSIRKVQHQYEKDITAHHFQCWDADTRANALEIEFYFHELGMRDKNWQGGTKPNSTWVYIFKINAHFLDRVVAILD